MDWLACPAEVSKSATVRYMLEINHGGPENINVGIRDIRCAAKTTTVDILREKNKRQSIV